METKQHANQATQAVQTPSSTAQRVRGAKRLFPFEIVMMLPALIVLAAISIIPFFYIIWMSFNEVSLMGGVSFNWVGLSNWAQMFSDPDVRGSWGTSLIY